jgi:hypothetical protein
MHTHTRTHTHTHTGFKRHRIRIEFSVKSQRRDVKKERKDSPTFGCLVKEDNSEKQADNGWVSGENHQMNFVFQ